VAGADQWLLYGGMAIWMLTALPALRYLPKAPRPKPQPAPESVQEPVAVREPETQQSQDATAVDLPDVDAILEELLRDFGKIDKGEA
jgi:hypothetical protein